jgi:hypothetical protein
VFHSLKTIDTYEFHHQREIDFGGCNQTESDDRCMTALLRSDTARETKERSGEGDDQGGVESTCISRVTQRINKTQVWTVKK